MSIVESVSENDRRIVYVEVESSVLPELMANLGEFAITHATAIYISGQTIPTEAYPRNDRESYNPDLVSWVTDNNSNLDLFSRVNSQNNTIPVISVLSFIDFTLKDQISNKAASKRIFNALKNKALKKEEQFGYMYVASATDSVYIRADRLSELVERLESGDISIDDISRKSVEVLSSVANALNITEQD